MTDPVSSPAKTKVDPDTPALLIDHVPEFAENQNHTKGLGTLTAGASRQKSAVGHWLSANSDSIVSVVGLTIALVFGPAAWWIWSGGKLDFQHHYVQAAAMALLAAGALVTVMWRDRLFVAAVMATGPAVPTLATVTAVAFYLTWDADTKSFVVGTAVAIPTWLLAALIFRRSASVDRANPGIYDAFQQRKAQAEAECEALCQSNNPQLSNIDGQAACTEAKRQLEEIERLITGPGDTRWFTGTGYSNLWSQIHRVEEALIIVQHEGTVIGGAIDDEQRLAGSTVGNKDVLLKNLRQAVLDLRPPATRYLKDQALVNARVGDNAPIATTTTTSSNGSAADGNPLGATDTALIPLPGAQSSNLNTTTAEARAILRAVSHAINVFQDGRYSGLIQIRNRLYLTGMFTGLFIYFLTGLAIVQEVSSETIAASVTFYLVGSVVGLFNRLANENESDAATEDYGLSTVRLLFAPMFSGLAAVGGVLIVALIPALTPDAGEPDRTVELLELTDIFNLSKNQMGLVVAAIFGLTPQLLISRLKQTPDRYIADIKSVQISTPQTGSVGSDS